MLPILCVCAWENARKRVCVCVHVSVCVCVCAPGNSGRGILLQRTEKDRKTKIKSKGQPNESRKLRVLLLKRLIFLFVFFRVGGGVTPGTFLPKNILQSIKKPAKIHCKSTSTTNKTKHIRQPENFACWLNVKCRCEIEKYQQMCIVMSQVNYHQWTFTSLNLAFTELTLLLPNCSLHSSSDLQNERPKGNETLFTLHVKKARFTHPSTNRCRCRTE